MNINAITEIVHLQELILASRLIKICISVSNAFSSSFVIVQLHLFVYVKIDVVSLYTNVDMFSLTNKMAGLLLHVVYKDGRQLWPHNIYICHSLIGSYRENFHIFGWTMAHVSQSYFVSKFQITFLVIVCNWLHVLFLQFQNWVPIIFTNMHYHYNYLSSLKFNNYTIITTNTSYHYIPRPHRHGLAQPAGGGQVCNQLGDPCVATCVNMDWCPVQHFFHPAHLKAHAQSKLFLK